VSTFGKEDAMKSKIKTCYVLAPADTNLEPLRAALQERDIAVFNPEIVADNLLSAEGTPNYIEHVDLVVGILSNARRSDWTLFELGVALANKRKILLIVPPGVGLSPPLDQPAMLVVRSSPANIDAIGFGLDQLILAPTHKAEPAATSSSGRRGLSAAANAFEEAARKAIDNGDGRALEEIIADILENAHLDIVANENQQKDSGVDFAVWVDELADTVGTPLLIEVKLNLPDRLAMKKAAAKLSEITAASSARFGLLVYGTGPRFPQADLTLPFNVLALSVMELIQELRHQSFSGVVNRLRNRRVHAVAD
jgi:hypothetical protein